MESKLNKLHYSTGLTYPVLEFVEFRRRVIERMMIEGDVDFTQEVITTEPITVPDHYTQRPRLQLTLGHVVLQQFTQTHLNTSPHHGEGRGTRTSSPLCPGRGRVPTVH